jgi:hypothetical protein
MEMNGLPRLFTTLLALTFLLAAAPAFAVKRRAFVTSVSGTADLSTWTGANGQQGLAAGDSICQSRAAAAGLPNPGGYIAWLSDDQNDAYCRARNGFGWRSLGCGGVPLGPAGPWFLANGATTFTADLDSLTQARAEIYRPVILDEFVHEVDVDRQYWTGTEANGEAWPGGSCQGWTSSEYNLSGNAGLSFATTDYWTQGSWFGCNQTARLLCLERGPSETVRVPWSPGSIVFTTSALGTADLESWPENDSATGEIAGDTGLAIGDVICRNLAATAHLPQPDSFVAWLSDSSVDARDRVTSNGPYRRIDGYAIANSKAELVGGVTANSLHVDENGDYLADDQLVWTGTNADGVEHPHRCWNWTSETPSDAGRIGRSSVGRDPAWTSDESWSCNTFAALYCFSNAVTLFWDGFEFTGDTSRWSSKFP